MIRATAAVALLATAFAAPAARAADYVEYVSGSRLVGIFNNGPIGQSFVADRALLTGFGFQFAALVASQADNSVTFQLLEGAGLNGRELFSSTSAVTETTSRTNIAWHDFALGGGVALTAGASYTALVSVTSTRLALAFGPNSGSSADAYAPGALTARVTSSQSFTGCDATPSPCDANFRLPALSAVAPVPEPGSWGAMLVGFALTGAWLRRRRTTVSFAEPELG